MICSQSTRKTVLFCVVSALLLTVPGRVRADDGNSDPPARTPRVKPDAPPPALTERERLLLDRVEQLESRMAEMEGEIRQLKGTPTPAATASAQLASVSAEATPSAVEA